MSLANLHTEGGIPYMIPIDILLIANLSLIGYLIFSVASKKQLHPRLLEIVKHIGSLALAWGAFGTLVGLFEAFRDLEAMTEMIPFNVLCGGMKVALITALYGLITYLVSLLSFIILKASQNAS